MKYMHFLFFFIVSSCSVFSILAPKPVAPETRPVQYLPGSSFDSNITNGLSNSDREQYYHFDYGIQWLPTNVFLSLKRASNTTIPSVMDEMFFAHPERFGLLPDYIDPHNPLPIGITKSTDPSYAPLSGINCASCHSSLISNSNGQFFIVDSGSSRFQIDKFIGEMLKSVVATLINPVEFEAFWQRYQILANITDNTTLDSSSQILSSSVQKTLTTSDTTELETKLQTAQLHQSGKATTLTCASYPTNQQLSTRTGMYVYMARRFAYLFSLTKYGTNPANSSVADNGPGRSNPWAPSKGMFSKIYLQTQTQPKNVGGPVNTPFMWNYDRQHWIFLLGNTNSMVERNTAQALALLADFNTSTYETTISIKNLDAISQYTKKVRAPSWPESVLGPINKDLADTGKAIFKVYCLNCHDPKSTSTQTGTAFYNYVDMGTDPNYYYGQTEKIDGNDLFGDILTPFISKVKRTAALNEGITDLPSYEIGRTPVVWKRPTSNAIIAKPLAGVWSCPPFLHNGSVPTIRDLLNPAFMRPKEFHIGGFVYNSKDLGYIEDTSLSSEYDFKIYCAACDGNSNAGHEIATELTNQAKDAIIEFLKSYDEQTTF